MLLQSVTLLRRQKLLTEYLINSSGSSLERFQTALTEQKLSTGHVLDVLNYAFGLIDNLVRFQKIAGKIPQLSQKSAECKALASGMGNLKKIRNQHQHIIEHLLNEFSGPLLGALSWVAGTKNYLASFQDIGRERSIPTMIFDTHEKRFTQEFCYVYGEKYYDLKKAIDAMHQFSNFIESSVQIQLNGQKINPDDMIIAICVELKFPNE